MVSIFTLIHFISFSERQKGSQGRKGSGSHFQYLSTSRNTAGHMKESQSSTVKWRITKAHTNVRRQEQYQVMVMFTKSSNLLNAIKIACTALEYVILVYFLPLKFKLKDAKFGSMYNVMNIQRPPC